MSCPLNFMFGVGGEGTHSVEDLESSPQSASYQLYAVGISFIFFLWTSGLLSFNKNHKISFASFEGGCEDQIRVLYVKARGNLWSSFFFFF